jgi:hypothetical protein
MPIFTLFISLAVLYPSKRHSDTVFTPKREEKFVDRLAIVEMILDSLIALSQSESSNRAISGHCNLNSSSQTHEETRLTKMEFLFC